MSLSRNTFYLVLVHWIVAELDSGSHHLAGGSARRLFVFWHTGPRCDIRVPLGEAPQRSPKVQASQWIQQHHRVGLRHALVGNCLNTGRPFCTYVFLCRPQSATTSGDLNGHYADHKPKSTNRWHSRSHFFCSLLCSTFFCETNEKK